MILHVRFQYVVLVVILAVTFSKTCTAQSDEKASVGLRGSGTLVICGGGRLPDSIYREFARIANAPEKRLVVIPTAGGREPDKSAIVDLWRERGFEQVSILHTRDASIADQDEFASVLREAQAVWISGGQQSRLAASYQGTQVQQELLSLLERGGVIGGSSAGAAIMSQTMIAGGRDEPELSIGLNLFEGAIVDQHFLKRSRVNRLVSAVIDNPELVGFGIDESTAMIVTEEEARILGDSFVVEITATQNGQPRFRIHPPGDVVKWDQPDE